MVNQWRSILLHKTSPIKLQSISINICSELKIRYLSINNWLSQILAASMLLHIPTFGRSWCRVGNHTIALVEGQRSRVNNWEETRDEDLQITIMIYFTPTYIWLWNKSRSRAMHQLWTADRSTGAQLTDWHLLHLWSTVCTAPVKTSSSHWQIEQNNGKW